MDNLTLEGAVNTAFNGDGDKYNLGFGAKVGYKFALDDKFYVQPSAAFNGESRIAGDEELGWDAHAGVLFGWGEMATAIDTYFFDDSDTDWGYYPGVSVGVTLSGDTANPSDAKMPIGLNVSTMTGSLVENLTAAAAFEVKDFNADKKEMGFVTVLKYAIKQEKMTFTPN